MARITIAHTPYSDAATLAGGSWTAGLPLANLKIDKLFQTARSSDATLASTKFTVDYGAAQALSGVIFGPTNLDADNKVRVKGAPTNSFASGYDSGWLTSGITAADIDPERGFNFVSIFAAVQTYRWWSIEIDDTANAAGYVEIGRLFMPQLLQPSANYPAGSNGLTFEDLTRRVETLSGVENSSRRRNRRVLNFAVPVIDQDEAFGSIYRFERTVGFDKTVFVIPDPADTAHMQARAFWGRIGTMDPITQVEVVNSTSFGLTIREQF